MWPVSQCAATRAEAVAYPQCAENPQFQKVRVDCGAYQTITQYGLDSNVSCWYEVASGKLVAVTSNSNGSPKCWGPPGGISSDCSNAITTTVCLADGGVPPDAGAANCLSTGSLPYFTWNAPCFADAGSLCYGDCVAGGGKYVGCVADHSTSPSAARCYASCSQCP